MHGPVLGPVGLGGEGRSVPSWSQSVARSQPQSRPSGRQRVGPGPGSAMAFGPLLCAPLCGDHGDWEVQAGPGGRTVKSRGTWGWWKAVPRRGGRTGGAGRLWGCVEGQEGSRG